MTQPAATGESLPRFDEHRRAVVDAHVVHGMGVAVGRVNQLVTELGHDPDRTVSVHVDHLSVTVVTAYRAAGQTVLVTTQHKVER